MAVYPGAEFRFELEIDGLYAGRFMEMSGGVAFNESIGYRDSNMFLEMSHKVAGLGEYSNIILKRGMIEEPVLSGWLAKGLTGAVERKTVTVRLLDAPQSAAASWQIINAWPVKYTSPDFSAASNMIAIETLELAHEGMTRKL